MRLDLPILVLVGIFSLVRGGGYGCFNGELLLEEMFIIVVLTYVGDRNR